MRRNYSVVGVYAGGYTRAQNLHDHAELCALYESGKLPGHIVTRTAPFAGLVYALVLLWYAGQARQGTALGWVPRPWYRTKSAPSFLDMLTALRQQAPRSTLLGASWCPRCLQYAEALSPAAARPAA